jgi:hypothetical protein
VREQLTILAGSPKPAQGAELSERLRLLRRRRQSRLFRRALSTAAWLAISLLGMGCLVGSILTWMT